MTAFYAIEATASPDGLPAEAAIELRQLRHQTRNALQRILRQVLQAWELDRNRVDRSIADDIGRRIDLSVEISDALFGFTRSAEPFPARLRRLSESLIAVHADAAQMIQLEISVEENILLSRRREDAVLWIVHELVANAVQHGLYMRLIGRIEIRLIREANDSLLLTVANDGWHMDPSAVPGEGILIVRELAVGERGDVQITVCPETSVKVHLASERHRQRATSGRELGPFPSDTRLDVTAA